MKSVAVTPAPFSFRALVLRGNSTETARSSFGCLGVFWVVTVLAGLAFPAFAAQTPVGGDTSLNGIAWKSGLNPAGGPACGVVPPYWCGSTPTFHALADVNGDGFADLIYTVAAGLNTPAPNVYVQYSNGSSFGAPVVVATDSSNTATVTTKSGGLPVAQAWILAVGDVNGDRLPDILFADGTVALGNGSGFGPKTAWGGDTSLNGSTWASGVNAAGGPACGVVPPYWCGSTPTFHALADVNGDGFADLIYTVAAGLNTPAPYVYVQYSNGSSFGAPVVVATDSSNTATVTTRSGGLPEAQAWILAVGDVNGDRFPDILFADGTVALGNGSGFGPKTAWGGDTSLNGSTWASGVNSGGGPACGVVPPYWCGSTPTFHALADVNGDGFADLIFTVAAGLNAPAPNVYVQFSNGSSFGAPVVVATDSSNTATVTTKSGGLPEAQAWILAVGDVNGDGQKDLLFANGSVSTVPIPFIVHPKYFIGSVLYVPPGQGSSIAYGAGTVTGTTVSTMTSWSGSSQVTVSDTGGTSHITIGDTFGGSTTQSVDMAQTITQNTTYKAPPSDLINHDYDQIQIFLGVKVHASSDYLGKVTWSLDFSKIASQGFAETGYTFSVGCVRSNSTIPASLCTNDVNLLSSLGITSADYPNLLGADPFADPNASPTPDPSRYVLIDSVQYHFDPVTSVLTYTENNSTNATNSTMSTYGFFVESSVEGQVGLYVKLKDENKFSWTVQSTQSNKTGSTNSSTFTLSNPSSTYSGPTTLFVYMDTIFKTFMFSFNQ